VLDDEAQVRDMIGRFRITYNARLASHADKRSGGPLTFAPCEVVIEGGLATATCPVRPPPLDVSEPSAWRFTLQQAGAAWAIRSIAAN
jgi:hypothetical protein